MVKRRKKRKPLTQRQQRYLSKIGLMPLTGMTKIAKRTRISKILLEGIERPSTAKLETKLALINKLKKNPETRALAYSPKLWIITRLTELAKKHNVPEIHKILTREAKQKNAELAKKYPSKYPKRTRRVYKVNKKYGLLGIIQKLNLRTREDILKTQQKAREKRRKRKKNKLSKNEKTLLLGKAQKYLNKILVENRNEVSANDLNSEIIERLMDEVNYFKPKPYKTKQQLARHWMDYIFARTFGRYRFFLVDALRKIGPLTRGGNPRRLPQEKEKQVNKAQIAKTHLAFETLKFRVPLTKTERKVLNLLSEDLSRKQIAKILNVNPNSLSHHIKNIRQKVVK